MQERLILPNRCMVCMGLSLGLQGLRLRVEDSRMNIGSVRADNIENPADYESIRRGFIEGDGLLGEIIVAVHDLVDAVRDEEPYSRPRCGPAWLNLYRALKAIEKAE